MRVDREDAPQEDVLEPELPIVDAHHHLWPTGYRIPYDRRRAPRSGRGHNVVASVFVECRTLFRSGGDEACARSGRRSSSYAIRTVRRTAETRGWPPACSARRTSPVPATSAARWTGTWRRVRTASGAFASTSSGTSGTPSPGRGCRGPSAETRESGASPRGGAAPPHLRHLVLPHAARRARRNPRRVARPDPHPRTTSAARLGMGRRRAAARRSVGRVAAATSRNRPAPQRRCSRWAE